MNRIIEYNETIHFPSIQKSNDDIEIKLSREIRINEYSQLEYHGCIINNTIKNNHVLTSNHDIIKVDKFVVNQINVHGRIIKTKTVRSSINRNFTANIYSSTGYNIVIMINLK